jgi:hypothetical protein
VQLAADEHDTLGRLFADPGLAVGEMARAVPFQISPVELAIAD